MQPQTIRDPPPNLTVPLTWWSCRPDPGFFHTQDLPSDPILLILVSSDQTTLPQSSRVQCWCSKANSSCLLLWVFERKGFFFFTADLRPALLSAFLII